MNAQKIIILVAYFLAALLLVSATTNDFYESEKRANSRPFMMGMRYGRAGKTIKSSGKHVAVVPRNDRFFLGSRYGKRSSEMKTSSSLDYPLCVMNNDLTCTYTGVSNIYRCIQSFEKDSSFQDELSTSI